MVINHVVISISALLVYCANAWAVTPDQFIADLKYKSPTHDGAPLRSFRVEDVNGDAQPEVLEAINSIEEESTGFLNVELYPAFEWINVYQKKGDSFVLGTEEFPEFLRNRKAFYLSWLERFENLKTVWKRQVESGEVSSAS